MPFISNIYSTSTTDNSSVKKFNESEIYVTSSLGDILQPNYSSNPSTGSYYDMNHYKKGNHFYLMKSSRDGTYSTDAVITFYDVDLTTHVATLRTRKIGTMSENGYGSYTRLISIIDGKALIKCGDYYGICGLYDFENDTFTKIIDNTWNQRVYCDFQVGYIGWSNSSMTNLKTFVNTNMRINPIALIKDTHTGRDAWISGIKENDNKQYMFFDDNSGTVSNISSFPDCKFVEQGEQSMSDYVSESKMGLNRNTNCTRNLVSGYIRDSVCSIYDIYAFDSSKSELKIHQILAPHSYKLYKSENNSMFLVSPIYSCYHTNDPTTYSVALSYSISDQPLEWYGMLFENNYSISDIMGKYTLDE